MCLLLLLFTFAWAEGDALEYCTHVPWRCALACGGMAIEGAAGADSAGAYMARRSPLALTLPSRRMHHWQEIRAAYQGKGTCLWWLPLPPSNMRLLLFSFWRSPSFPSSPPPFEAAAVSGPQARDGHVLSVTGGKEGSSPFCSTARAPDIRGERTAPRSALVP